MSPDKARPASHSRFFVAMEITTRRYEFLMEIITIGYWSTDGLGFKRERYGAIDACFVCDDLVSLKTIEDHPKFGRVHSLYVGPADESVNNDLEMSAVCSSKPNEWSQDMNVSLAFGHQPPPPRIPPHLLNILLNRKLPENVSIGRVSFVSHSIVVPRAILISCQNRTASCFDISTLCRYKYVSVDASCSLVYPLSP